MRYIEQLYELVSRLRRPCLRLRILQQILGLDARFERHIVHGVICLAFDVLEDLGGGRPRDDASHRSGAAEPRWRASGGALATKRLAGGGALLDLDGFDEATHLEAQALFGRGDDGKHEGGTRDRPSDPLGDESRRGRVRYFYR